MDMAQQDPKLHSELRPKISVNIGRRRVITGMGALAAASWLPHSIRAQNTVPEADILVIGGGIAGASTAFHAFDIRPCFRRTP